MTAEVIALHTEHEIPAGTLTPHDACLRSGATYRQLDYWTRVGLAKDVRPDGHGSGYRRYYTTDEVAVLTLVTRLAHAGVDVRVAFDHARRLLEHGTTVLAGITLHLPEDL